MERDTVVLDVYIIRIPPSLAETNTKLWQEVDELHLPPPMRRNLAQHGFRAGIVGTHPPLALSQLLELRNKRGPANEPVLTQATDLAEEPGSMWARHQVRAGRRVEVQMSQVFEWLPVVEWKGGALVGDTLEQAQAVIALEARPDGGAVVVRLTPELRHGVPQATFSGNQGILKWQVESRRKTFEALAAETRLLPGQMILLGAVEDCSTSISRHFFQNETTRPGERKLLVVRVSQTQTDDLFDDMPSGG